MQQQIYEIQKIIEKGEIIPWSIVTVITAIVIALTNTLIYVKLFNVKIKGKKDIIKVTAIETIFKCIYLSLIHI
mgnify:FL=1